MIVRYQNATLVTAQGIQNIALVINTGTGKILPPENAGQQTVNAGGLYLYPGLINAHDHLELNHYPRTKYLPRYENARYWAEDMTQNLQQEPFASLQKYPLHEKCLIGGLKNLFSGVTTTVHHNPLHRPLTAGWFPVHVVRHYGWSHSLYLSREIQQSYRQTRRGIWMIHLAEGTDEEAAQEFSQLEALGCISEKTILIHGVGLPGGLTEKPGGLVWCPSTNFFLLGETAEVKPWYMAGKLALGSDSRLTADGDLLDELKAAHHTGQLSVEQLFHIVTGDAAKILHLPHLGDLHPGKQADVIALPQSLHPNPYQALINAKRSDIVWVMRKGKILWQQDQLTPNCLLDGIPYRLNDSVLKMVRKSHLQEPGLSILTEI
ncbi:MAG: amidohydrolase family protein [Anaerolineae bacterium]|nr:amidohydrolase family protein [Anaerolineae bacterium]